MIQKMTVVHIVKDRGRIQKTVHNLSMTMDYLKNTIRLSLLVIVVAAFVDIPYGAAIVAVLGLAIGLQRDSGDLVRTLAIAIGLSISADALDAIPAIGSYVTAIADGGAALAAASALGVLGKWAWEQVGV